MTYIMNNKKRLLIALACVVLACVSFFWLGDYFSNPDTYSKLISILDDKKSNVMGLTASTSAASIAITAIPDDIGTPIANQLADLSGYLLVILTVLYLEKYLLTVIGFGVFKIIVPLACGLLIWHQFKPINFSIRSAAIKIGIFGICLFALIPTSVLISNMIDKTYEQSINETLNNTNQVVEAQEPQTTEQQDDLKWYEKIYAVFSKAVDDVKDSVITSASSAIDKAKNMLSNFIEATAVMIVTSCLIPILTVIVFMWLSKIVLGIELNKPHMMLEMKDKAKSLVHLQDDETITQ